MEDGFCAVAALDKHWAGGGSFSAMTAGPLGAWQSWDVEQLLAVPAARKAVLVTSGLVADLEALVDAGLLEERPGITGTRFSVRPQAPAVMPGEGDDVDDERR